MLHPTAMFRLNEGKMVNSGHFWIDDDNKRDLPRDMNVSFLYDKMKRKLEAVVAQAYTYKWEHELKIIQKPSREA